MTWPDHALITGASGQLGSALARQLAASGCHLSLCSLDQDELHKLADEIRASHDVEVATQILDIRDRAAFDEWVAKRDDNRPIQWFVLAAGIVAGVEDGEFVERPQQITDVVDVNLTATIHCLATGSKHLKKRRAGKVILVSSLSALIGYPRAPTYAATKAALRVLGLSLRPALKKEGIDLMIACPGFLTSPMQSVAVRNWAAPMAVTAESAADAILRAAKKGKAQLLYPASMSRFLRVMGMLPIALRERLLERLQSSK